MDPFLVGRGGGGGVGNLLSPHLVSQFSFSFGATAKTRKPAQMCNITAPTMPPYQVRYAPIRRQSAEGKKDEY